VNILPGGGGDHSLIHCDLGGFCLLACELVSCLAGGVGCSWHVPLPWIGRHIFGRLSGNLILFRLNWTVCVQVALVRDLNLISLHKWDTATVLLCVPDKEILLFIKGIFFVGSILFCCWADLGM
jgi:hypothetical protein